MKHDAFFYFRGVAGKKYTGSPDDKYIGEKIAVLLNLNLIFL